MNGPTADLAQSTYELREGYHGTHIESPSNQGLEYICTQYGIFPLKNWAMVSSSPIVAQNSTYRLSDTKKEVARIVRQKLQELLSSPAGIAHIKSSNIMDILIGEFDPEVSSYIQTIEIYSERWKVLNEEYDVSLRDRQGVWVYQRSWTSENYTLNRIFAVLDWVKLNADGPVSVI